MKRQPLSGDTGGTFDSETEDVTTSDLDNGKPKHRCSHELGKCYGLKATRHPGAGIGSSRAAVVSLNACWRPSVLANDGTPKPVPTSSSSLAASSAPRNVSTVAKHGLTWQAQAGSYFTGDSNRTLACRYAHSEGQKADPRETPWCSPTEARHDRPERVLRAHCGLLLSCRAASLRPRLAGQTPWCAARLTGAQTDAYPACASARYALCNWMTHSVTSSLLARSTSQDTRAASGPRWRCAPVPVPHRGFATQSAILGRLRTSRQVHPQPHRPDD